VIFMGRKRNKGRLPRFACNDTGFMGRAVVDGDSIRLVVIARHEAIFCFCCELRSVICELKTVFIYRFLNPF